MTKMVVPLAFIAQQKVSRKQFEKAATDYLKARRSHSEKIGEPAPLPPFGLDGLVLRTPPADEKPEKFELNYVIEEPPPQPSGEATTVESLTLDDKKRQLALKMQLQASSIREAIFPALKMRRQNILFVDAMQKKANDESSLTDEEKTIITQMERKMAQAKEIELHLAGLEEEISDLTAENIDNWTPAPFPKVGA